MAEENRRQYFRIQYLVSDKPKLVIGRKTYEVIDVSERGLRFAVAGGKAPQLNSNIRGDITFPDNKTFAIEGTVLRINPAGTEVSVHLTRGIPLVKMMEENRKQIKITPR